MKAQADEGAASRRHAAGEEAGALARCLPSQEARGDAAAAATTSAHGGNFALDSVKPWYMFGRGAVDRTGQVSGGPAWVPDARCATCMACRAEFGMFRRRHHCRFCGNCLCGDCSSKFMLLPVKFGVREPQRVCDTCAATLAPMQDQLADTMSNATRTLTVNASTSMLPVSVSMSAEISKACLSVHNFFGTGSQALLKDAHIPELLLRQAKGICFLTVLKAGLVFSGRFGSGLVLARDRQGAWTAPSAVALMGFGWGAQIGGEVTTFVIILNTEAAVDAFSGKGQVALGSQVAVAAGPLGRQAEASINIGDGGGAPCFSYSQSQGLFVGMSLEGAVITTRQDVNERFYGRQHDPKDLLAGRVPAPRAAQPLYEALAVACERSARATMQTSPGLGAGVDI